MRLRRRNSVDKFFTRSSRFVGLTTSQYTRLMIFACVDAFLTFPFCIVTVALATGPSFSFTPYESLKEIHQDYSHVGEYPVSAWRIDPITRFETLLSHGVTIASSIIFFAFFGLHKEARSNYRSAYISIRHRIHRYFAKLRARITGTPL